MRPIDIIPPEGVAAVLVVFQNEVRLVVQHDGEIGIPLIDDAEVFVLFVFDDDKSFTFRIESQGVDPQLLDGSGDGEFRAHEFQAQQCLQICFHQILDFPFQFE
ncbi:hypothetical protein SDC9_197531 [bioreactor metagenome]|uniref:Uncharacterized protein n=1 Tax=bioreactor metagenome TaxID=1076179 RepID=A0A645IF42_9ZZZZ